MYQIPTPSNRVNVLEPAQKTVGDIEGCELRPQDTLANIPPLLAEPVERAPVLLLAAIDLHVRSIDVEPRYRIGRPQVARRVDLLLDVRDIRWQEDIAVQVDSDVLYSR